MKIRLPRLLPTLEVLKAVLVFIMLIMFINFNAQVAHQTDNTQKLAESTNRVVKNQGDILKAIKQVTEDTKITANEQTSIIICMLQVPIEQRTTDLQTECRKQVVKTAPASKTTASTSTPTPVAPQATPKTVTPVKTKKTPKGLSQLVDKIKELL